MPRAGIRGVAFDDLCPGHPRVFDGGAQKAETYPLPTPAAVHKETDHGPHARIVDAAALSAFLERTVADPRCDGVPPEGTAFA